MKTLHGTVPTLFAAILTAALCLGQAPAARQSYTFHGTVVSVNKDTQRLSVDGEKVDGWMRAMTMNYKVDNPSIIAKLKPGERITATVYDGDQVVLHNVTAVGPATTQPASGPVVGQAASGQAPAARKSYTFHGTVVSVNKDTQRLSVDGEKVDGWMRAMTMNYKVDNPSIIAKLKPGERITATVYDGDQVVLHNVTAVGPATTQPASGPVVGQAASNPSANVFDGQVPGWDARWPPVARVLAGCDPQRVREFQGYNAALVKNPKDEGALVNRAVSAHRLARTSKLDMYLDWLAAKDLEQAIKLDPNDFTAWHNYGDLNYSQGDMWAINDHSNRNRALWAFNHAIALNPNSARTYLGRGWTYYELNDLVHANSDFQKALQLDPSLRADMQTEIANIQERHSQEDAARGTISQMSRYYVLKTARNDNECAEGKGTWVISTSKDGHITGGECHVSMALYPGPTQPWEGK